MLHLGESTRLAFDIHAAPRAYLGKPRVINIVQSQSVAGDPQLGDKIHAADTGTDDGNRRAHAIAPDWRSWPSVSLS